MDDGTGVIVAIVVAALVALVVIRVLFNRGRPLGEIPPPPTPPMPSPPPLPRSSPPAGPGRFVIHGVDRASRMDTTWHVQADSEANARVKADLEGIAVTSVQRE